MLTTMWKPETMCLGNVGAGKRGGCFLCPPFRRWPTPQLRFPSPQTIQKPGLHTNSLSRHLQPPLGSRSSCFTAVFLLPLLNLKGYFTAKVQKDWSHVPPIAKSWCVHGYVHMYLCVCFIREALAGLGNQEYRSPQLSHTRAMEVQPWPQARSPGSGLGREGHLERLWGSSERPAAGKTGGRAVCASGETHGGQPAGHCRSLSSVLGTIIHCKTRRSLNAEGCLLMDVFMNAQEHVASPVLDVRLRPHDGRHLPGHVGRTCWKRLLDGSDWLDICMHARACTHTCTYLAYMNNDMEHY